MATIHGRWERGGLGQRKSQKYGCRDVIWWGNSEVLKFHLPRGSTPV